MNPKPLSALNHLTVPCAILAVPSWRGTPSGRGGGPPRCFPGGSAVYRVGIPCKRVLRPAPTLSQIAVHLTFLAAQGEKWSCVSRDRSRRNQIGGPPFLPRPPPGGGVRRASTPPSPRRCASRPGRIPSRRRRAGRRARRPLRDRA